MINLTFCRRYSQKMFILHFPVDVQKKFDCEKKKFLLKCTIPTIGTSHYHDSILMPDGEAVHCINKNKINIWVF